MVAYFIESIVVVVEVVEDSLANFVFVLLFYTPQILIEIVPSQSEDFSLNFLMFVSSTTGCLGAA